MLSTSWPGLSRPSTSWCAKKDVDARHKAGHDELEVRGVRQQALSRRLLARLVDRDVLAMRQRGAAVGDDQRVELDEAVALLFVVAGDFCARRQFVAAAGGAGKLHPAADMNPWAQDGVIDQHLVHDPLQ